MEYISDNKAKNPGASSSDISKLRADGELTKVNPQMDSFKFYVRAPKKAKVEKKKNTSKKDKEDKKEADKTFKEEDKKAKVVKKEEKALSPVKSKIELFNSVSLTDKMLFMDNMSTMLKAGLSLTPALKTIQQEIKNKYFAKVLNYLANHIENGQPLSDGMKHYPKVFSEMVVATVEVGENTGMLSDTFGHLADIMKKQKELRSKVIGAMMYPVIVILALIAVSFFLALVIFPQLVGLFESAGVKLPFVLRAVNAFNFFIRNYGYYALVGLVVLGVLLKIVFSKNGPKLILHKVILALPFIGKLNKELALTRFAGNLNALLAAGLDIVKSMDIVSKTVGNLQYRKEIIQMAQELEKGQSLHNSMSKRPDLFPSLTIQLCQVGETTGQLEEILGKIGKFYEDRVNNILTNLSTILEPFLLVIVGVAVAFIAVSVIGPMYELTNSFAE